MVETDLGLELNVARSCTLACNGCNHSSTKYTERYFMAPEVVRRDLGVMKNHLKVKLFMAQGGEPTLSKDLVEILGIMYDSQMAKQCGVLSNGTLLTRMGDDLWEMLSTRKMELRLSVYPDLDPAMVSFALDMGQKWGFYVRPQTINSFKPLFLKNDGQTYHGCPWNRCLCIHEGYFYICPLSTFFPKQFMGLPEHIDGIPIEGMTDEKLNEILTRQHPLETCKICAGGRGEDIPWSQAKSKSEWMATAGMTPELIA